MLSALKGDMVSQVICALIQNLMEDQKEVGRSGGWYNSLKRHIKEEEVWTFEKLAA